MPDRGSSVEILLQQRQALRESLSDLRSEITKLKKTADNMVDTADEEFAKEPNYRKKEPQEERLFRRRRLNNVKPAEVIVAPIEKHRKIAEPARPMLEPSPPEPAETLTSDDVSASYPEMDKLLDQAILLARFFLHHPSSATDESLDRLDTAIARVQNNPLVMPRIKAQRELKESYRKVVQETYPEHRVSGDTLRQSKGRIRLLWGLPTLIAFLMLVAMPGILVMRAVAPQMFVASFSDDLQIALVVLFLSVWGIVGALTLQSFYVAREANKGRYYKGLFKGLALSAAVGAILGGGLYPLRVLMPNISPLQGDVIFAFLAFLAGLIVSIVWWMFNRRDAERY